MTVGNLFASIRNRLSSRFPAGEAKEMALLIFESVKGWNLTDILIHQEDDISDFIIDKTDSIVRRTLEGEPLQYITGVAHFYGFKLKVNPSTLIPRPETTELVDMIADRYRNDKDLRILDLGTGSGCIAIALARILRFPEVTAVDISEGALAVASRNAKDLGVRINFRKEDILHLPDPPHKYDIIVSNPPYITLKEAQDMDVNVIDHEPATALFVPDNDPLKFYTPIIRYAADNLVNRGGLFFEVNPLFADEIRRQILNAGFSDAIVIKDISAKNRFISATR